ncbi:MAG: PhoH family protein [Bdellovibrionales bacterium]|nr:PhoH family protein [Bdellovibrionales bacterium]
MLLQSHYHKKLVLDTSVILYDALAVKTFHKTDIYIPLPVIQEIDTFKKDMGEKGRNARQFSRFIDTLRNKGQLTKGVFLENCKSYVHINMLSDYENYLPSLLDNKKVDNQILGMVLFLQQHFPKASVELISKDINLRIKSDVFGIKSKNYDPDRISSIEKMYSGIRNISVTEKQLEEFFKSGFLKLKTEKFLANQYFVLSNKKQVGLGRYNRKKNQIVPLLSNKTPIWRVHPRNHEQNFALDALLNTDLLFVSLLGKAGTGKTLLALAAGLRKTIDEALYKRLLVCRPVFPMGKDIGYLPGDIEQKLNPWMQPIFDSLEYIMGMGKKSPHITRDLIDQGLLNIEPLAYIRGRSIPQQYIIVDEAQNLTPHEIKTIVTRAGTGTKVVLTGDCYQIDNPYIDASNNGLTYSIERFKGQDIFAHVTLTKGERSELAELATNLL